MEAFLFDQDMENFVDYARTLLTDYLNLTGRGLMTGNKKIRCLNPSHADHHPSMSYDEDNRRMHCFSCGASYDIFDIVGIDYPDCQEFRDKVRKIADIFGLEVPGGYLVPGRAPEKRLQKGQRRRSRTPAGELGEAAVAADLRPDYTAFVTGCIALHGAGGDYFQSRGISPRTCEKFRLFEHEGRAYLPVFDGERCVSYCSRAIEEDMRPKYLNSPGLMGIFGADALFDGQKDVVVTESIFDALSAEECGVRAIALCGAGNASKFIRLCAEHPEEAACHRFLLAGDRDAAGARMNGEMERALELLGLKGVGIVLPETVKDLNELLVLDRNALEAALQPPEQAKLLCAADYLPQLMDPLQSPWDRSAVKSGLDKLDTLLGGGFYAGLYVLGAVSSAGKTSLALQIGDEVARRGTDVLYFSLEMHRLELIAKSVSRLSCLLERSRHKGEAPLTARDVLAAGKGAGLKSAAKEYAAGSGRHMYLFEGMCGMGVAAVRQAVEEHVRATGRKPLVIVDYLQILDPEDSRSTDKQNTDRAVVALKRLSRDFGVPVLAVSSFNRENYRNAVSMESFKESGAVEYSSDVLLGLQFTGVGEPRFDLTLAKAANPRRMELVLLKNRSGVGCGCVKLRYYAPYSLFLE